MKKFVPITFDMGYHDFRTEYAEDIAELKRALQELRRNKVWIPRERF
jgi:hypothetical protein